MRVSVAFVVLLYKNIRGCGKPNPFATTSINKTQGGRLRALKFKSLILVLLISLFFLSAVFNLKDDFTSLFQNDQKNHTLQTLSLQKQFVSEKLKFFSYQLNQALKSDDFFNQSNILLGFVHFKKNEHQLWENKKILEKTTLKQFWSSSFLGNLPSYLRVFEYSDQISQWKVVSNLQGHMFLVNILPLSKNEYLLGVFNKEQLSILTLNQKLEETETLVFNSDQQGISYSQLGYEGSSFSKHEFLKRYFKKDKLTQWGSFSQSDDGESFGAYDLIPGTNLYLSIFKTEADLSGMFAGLFHKLAVITFGLFVLGLVLFYIEEQFFSKNSNQGLKDISEKKAQDILRDTNGPIRDLNLGSSDGFQEKITLTNESLKKSIELVQSEAFIKKQDEFMNKIGKGITEILKIPLSSIIGFTQILRREYTSKVEDRHNFQSHLFNIENEARRIKNLLSHLNQYTRLSAQSLKEVEIDDILTPLMASYKMQCEVKGVYLFKDIHSHKSIFVDPGLLQKILIEVMDNALESMEFCEKKEVTFTYKDSGEGVELIVSDSGVGLSEETLKKSFDPFFSTKDFDDHDGLGLSVSLKAAKMMGVKVKMTSEENKGTSFILEFTNTNDNLMTVCENTLTELHNSK